MRKVVLCLSAILFLNGLYAQTVAINSTGAVANSSAMLDISSTNTGLLVPRIALTSTSVSAPVTTPATSLLVYNTSTAGAGSTAVTPGYYYWNGTAWVRFFSGTIATGNGLSYGTAAPVLNEVILGGTLEQATNIDFDSYDMDYNLNGAGSFNVQNAGTNFFTFDENGSITHTLSTFYSSAFNLTSSADFNIQDAGITFFSFNDNGTITHSLASTSSSTVDLTSTGDFNIEDAGTTFFSFNDNGTFTHTLSSTATSSINLTGTGDFIVYDNGLSIFELNDATEAVINEASLDYNFRVETDNRINALLVDAGNDVVTFGSTGSLTDNGTTVNTIVVDYVADFSNGTADGTAVGVGSIEYLLDGNATTYINNTWSPSADITYDLGTSALAWDDVYADNYITISDTTAKKNIRPLKYGLNEILKLNTICYELKNDAYNEPKMGLIAQQLLEVMSETVQTGDYKFNELSGKEEWVNFDRMGVDYLALIPVLVNAIQEQNTVINELKAKLVLLEQQR